ncbi:MAG: hypothetical protein CVU56_03695 [Deltaproteobacteria bacterium HGW-Deltaproteobacteria-14]|jgi:hypothetical protein|nr:MAG: hypothetical protein CVU56_03695 [Deltaproteobacteria bacterium HGW-Deltaproteobacteria-14]
MDTRLTFLPLLALAISSAACGDDATPTDTQDTTVTADVADTGDPADAADAAPGDTTAPLPTGDCDPLDPSFCSLPWPSNLYLAPDASRVTGYTLTFGATSLPENIEGTHIDPAPYTRRDGYGPHEPLIVRFADLDVAGLPTEYDGASSLDADAAILWFAVAPDGTTKRVPYFVDVDIAAAPADRLLFVRPAVLLEEGMRYVVAFRRLKDTDGAPYAPSPAFAALLAGTTAGDPALAPRQARFDDVFGVLDGAGVDTSELILAWDFVTASADSLFGWMLDIRDKAFAATGEDGPVITITEVTPHTVEEDANIALDLIGTFSVPHFMEVGTSLNDIIAYQVHLGPDGRPAQDGWVDAPLWIRVPRSALDGTPHDLLLYGHGQNGRGSQVRGGFNARIANDHHYILAATDMWGMSEEDVPGILQTLADFSGFTRLSDRLLQGVVNHALLARALRRRLPGLSELAASNLNINTDEVYYSGISQGGIYGPVVVAVSPDIRRGHMGVPGNDYSFLLTRSRNFEAFFGLLAIYYPDRASQVIALQAVHELWNGADSVSYLRHIADPLPGSPANAILLAPAKGDVQVAVSSNDWVLRSDIGVALMANYDDEREIWGVTETPYPHTGSGLVLYDFGNPWPDGGVILPPTSDFADPHGEPRQEDYHNAQLAHFLRTGEIIDVCGGDGCHPD